MAQRIVVDPVTRIEGHLRVEAMLDESNHIHDAVSSGTMWRGLEVILQGRDPRDAWAFCERICGVCTTVHALASVRAVENALGITVPRNAEIIRNIMFLTQMVQDHVIHFYHLHALDWVDVVSALKANPAATAALAQKVSPSWPTATEGYFKDVAGTLSKFVASGQLGIFQNAYWGHPAYKLPPEANLMAVAHYLEALKWQKEIIKIHTIFGGKNPHPNYLVGGMASAIALNGDNAINIERLMMVKGLISDAINIVENLYIPDLLAVASFYPEWPKIGGGRGNYMCYGDLPQNGIADVAKFRFPRGVILNKNLAEVLPVDPADPAQVQEEISHSWYRYPGGKDALHPWDGVTEANYTGPKPPYKHFWDPATWKPESKGYGFTEAPRGALGHWVHIKDGKIANYQIVVPSTWNASPRDAKGQHGAYESALIGTPVADAKRPVEILRTIHSFDPCLACASHVFGPD